MSPARTASRRIVISCMKNEAAWLLEWVAWHLAAGFDHFLVFTNDCEDTTEAILDRLASLGIATRRDNARKPHQRASYQLRAWRRAAREPLVQQAEWAAILDVDELLVVRQGSGALDALLAAAGPADAISIPWRLFGSAGKVAFERGLVTRIFRRAAPTFCPRPAQAWGMKTLFRPAAFEAFGTHRPRRPRDGDWSRVRWVNPAGVPMPERYHGLGRGGWRFGRDIIDYRIAQVNHYAVRFAQSFLMKVLRGAPHGGIDRDARYWRIMDRNEVEDHAADRLLPAAETVLEELLSDPLLAELHEAGIQWHEREIARALKAEDMARLMAELVGGDGS